MAQTEKAKQAGQANQDSQNQNQSTQLTEELQKILAPMQEAITELKASKEQEAQRLAAEAEAKRQAKLNSDADLSTLLGGADVSESEDDKYEKLSKRQLVEVLTGAIETALEANAVKIKDDISQSLSPNKDKMAVMEKAIMGILGHMGVQEARSKHEDFDDYKDEISKIMGENAGLSFDDAYLLAKSRKAGAIPPKSQIDSEKPAGNAWQPGAPVGGVIPNQSTLQQIADRGNAAREDAGITKSGVVGFRNIVAAGVEKAVGDGRQ